ncbi:MAG: hypothetical protein Q8W48_10480 [Candidatus Palauibacterales bacterium]|nr:hypothetical protein [Candidatus Palauibacterales bacterium]
MLRAVLVAVAVGLLLPGSSYAQAEAIKSARSAGPASLSDNAAVLDWDLNQLREGSNGWTCLPDRPDTPGNDPWCVNEPWLNFLKAYMNKEEPTYTSVGVAYMLMGDTPVSNTDPYATEKTTDADWVEDPGAHLMMLVPDHKMLEGVSEDPNNGGPWIMWPRTPYVHLMIPIEGAPK